MEQLRYYAFRTALQHAGILCAELRCKAVFQGGPVVAVLAPRGIKPVAVVGFEAACPLCATLQHLPLVYPSPEAAIEAARDMRREGSHGDTPLIPVPKHGPLMGQAIETLEVADIAEGPHAAQ